MSAALMAAVCSIVLSTGEIHCEPPTQFEDARAKIEAIVPFFDPQLDKSYYFLQPATPVDEAKLMKPLKAEPEPVRQVEAEPEFISKYPSPNDVAFTSKYRSSKYASPYDKARAVR